MSFKLVKNAAGKVIAYGPGPSQGAIVDVFDEDGNITGVTHEEIDHYCPTVPEGCTLEIVDDYVHTPDPAEVALSTVVQLEIANPISHRTLREALLAVGALIEQVTGMPAAANPGFVKLAALNAQISNVAKGVRAP